MSVEAHSFRQAIVYEMPKRTALASDRSRTKRQSLPGMTNVVQTISIGPIAVLPGFAPDDAGENENERERVVQELPGKSPSGAPLRHVR